MPLSRGDVASPPVFPSKCEVSGWPGLQGLTGLAIRSCLHVGIWWWVWVSDQVSTKAQRFSKAPVCLVLGPSDLSLHKVGSVQGLGALPPGGMSQSHRLHVLGP